ncbi:OLC1v1019787C1 [Oldenlandia corymbosa var. corymbosa]|uniref:OLC1v1019787C1 n=1 Tax=Oldenlandia corymbosa var. corymbosa TaxID=529605 RepID=A0AAV1EES2_OLDCO|nr:OLC1v1019787C1 [Oldenlandia corymbosa var. corymbosa]
MDSAQKRNIPISEGALIPSADPVVPENANDIQEVPGEAYVTPPVQTSVSSSKTPDDGSHIAIPSVNSTAQSGTPAVTPPVPQLAAQRYIVDINGLVPTKTIHFNIVVRVMTIWKMYDTQNKKDVKSLELSLIDAQGSKIQATIPARIMKDFVKYFKDEGVCRRLSRFDHCLNINGGYRCSKHEYKIVFGSDTLVEQAVDLDIPNHVFKYTPFAEITNFVANFDYCCDLIGHIIGYSDPIVEKGKKRISVQLEDERADTLKVTLWEEHADRVLNCMNNEPEYPVVLIVHQSFTTTNLFNGGIYLNDMNIATYTSTNTGYTTFEDFVRDAEMLTLSGISELDQACNVVVFAKISGLAKENEWSYTGCSLCNRKVFEIEDAEKNNGGNKKLSFAKSRRTDNGKAISCPKKWMCSSHGPVSAVGPKFKLQVYVVDGSGSRIATLWDRMVYNFINKSAAELIQEGNLDYPEILEEIVGRKCLFRLDVSNYNIRNNTSEISVARIATDHDIIKKYLEAVSDDQDIDPELSAEFYHSVTPNQDSNAKTAVSCTDETDLMLIGDDSADSPPPKKFTNAHEVLRRKTRYISAVKMDYGYDQLVLVPANIRTKGLILSSNLTAILRHVGQQIMIEVPGIGSVFANMHINKKKRCQLYGSALEEFFAAIGVFPQSKIHVIYHKSSNVLHLFNFNHDGCQRFSPDLNANIGHRYLLELNPNNSLRCVINPQYFRGIDWPLNQTVSLILDDKHKQWNFNIYTQQGEPVGFEGKMWAEFHDLYFNHLRGVNVIFIYTGQLYFRLRVFNLQGSSCDRDISLRIHRRRLDIQDYNSLIIYYDEEPVIRMGRVYLSDYPNRFIVKGDIEYMMGLKKIPTGIKLGFHIDARKAVNKEHLILEVL